jgi:hypothetical protein
MKLPDFKNHSWLNALREKLWAEINFLYRPENNPIWDLKVTDLLQNNELINLDLSDISVWIGSLLEYKSNKVLVYQKHQLERWTEWNQQFHFFNCATIKNHREEKKYTWKYVINRWAEFRVDIESYWKSIQKNVSTDLRVCKNCLKESNYYDYEKVDYNKKNYIYKNFSIKEYLQAVD